MARAIDTGQRVRPRHGGRETVGRAGSYVAAAAARQRRSVPGAVGYKVGRRPGRRDGRGRTRVCASAYRGRLTKDFDVESRGSVRVLESHRGNGRGPELLHPLRLGNRLHGS